MRIAPCLLTVLAAGLLLSAARAQLPNASQQLQSFQQRSDLQASGLPFLPTNVPALYPGETSDVGPQSVVTIKPRRTWIEADADEQYFYTDNMFLTGQHKQGADVLVSTVQAAFAPTPFPVRDGQLAPRVGYQHQWFNFGLDDDSRLTVFNLNTMMPQLAKLDSFDFNASTVFGDLTWRQGNWRFTGGADFTRLLDSGSYNEFYREYVPRWSVERQFSLSPATGIAIGYDGDYRFTTTQAPPMGYGGSYNDRTDQGVYLVGSWRLCRYAILQPSYRFEYSHYTSLRRDDFLHSFDLTLYFPLTKNIALRGFIGYDDLNTDGLFAEDYEKLDVGGGLNLFVRF